MAPKGEKPSCPSAHDEEEPADAVALEIKVDRQLRDGARAGSTATSTTVRMGRPRPDTPALRRFVADESGVTGRSENPIRRVV